MFFYVYCQMETRKIFAKSKRNINFQVQFETLITATKFACSWLQVLSFVMNTFIKYRSRAVSNCLRLN